METTKLRRGELRGEIERLLETEPGLSSGEIARKFNADIGYVCKVRKIWGGSIKDYSKDTAYQSPEWYAQNDAKFRAKLEELARDGGGW